MKKKDLRWGKGQAGAWLLAIIENIIACDMLAYI